MHGDFACGKTTTLAEIVWRAESQGIDRGNMAVFAPNLYGIRRLKDVIGRAYGEAEDLFLPEFCGLPIEAMHSHSAMIGDSILDRDELSDEYLMLIARANGLCQHNPTDASWLLSLKPQVVAAIGADHESRLYHRPLPRNAYLSAVSEFIAEHKREARVLDRADLLHGDYYQSPQVKLLLLDEVAAEDRGILQRFFPCASVITTSHQPVAADVTVHLKDTLRHPARSEYCNVTPDLIPPPAPCESLLIATSKWRKWMWMKWLKDNHLPYPLARDAVPKVKIGLPLWLRACEADTVIVDDTGWPSEWRRVAMSRATKQLVLIKKIP